MSRMVWKPAARSRVYVVSGRHLYPGTVCGYSTHRRTGGGADEPYLTVD